jgi:hypothetical protein
VIIAAPPVTVAGNETPERRGETTMTATDLFRTLVERCARLGGVDLDVPARTTPPRAADFGFRGEAPDVKRPT